MATAVTYPHIVKLEGKPAHLERLPHRVAQIVVDYINNGWSPDEMCLHYPHLKQAEVHSAMAYYFDHKDEIDTEIAEEQILIEEWRNNTPPSPFMLRMKAQDLLP